MKLILTIGVGSFLGGTLRYMLSQWVQLKTNTVFPYGTLSVNIVGCLVIGVVIGLAEKFQLSNEWKLFLTTGILGGFTTFSAFSIDTITLFKSGQMMMAFAYILASVALGLIATYAAYTLTKIA